MDDVLVSVLVPQAVNPSIGITMGRIANVICLAQAKFPQLKWVSDQDPDGEIENSGNSIFEIRIPNFCYIQVFDLSFLPRSAVGTQQVRYHEKNVKNIKDVQVKNYNLNVTEIRDSDFKNAFSGVFNFTVGILVVVATKYTEIISSRH